MNHFEIFCALGIMSTMIMSSTAQAELNQCDFG